MLWYHLCYEKNTSIYDINMVDKKKKNMVDDRTVSNSLLKYPVLYTKITKTV